MIHNDTSSHLTGSNKSMISILVCFPLKADPQKKINRAREEQKLFFPFFRATRAPRAAPPPELSAGFLCFFLVYFLFAVSRRNHTNMISSFPLAIGGGMRASGTARCGCLRELLHKDSQRSTTRQNDTR